MLGIGFGIYHYFYPRKPIHPLIMLILISCLPIISVFRLGVYESGDFTLHHYRAIDFYQSLSEGNVFPSWAGNLNAHYGYPLFIFINPLPYYLLSFFHFIGFSFIFSMKLFLATSYISSGIAMYFFCMQVFSNKKAAFIASTFYLFAPYHLIDQHFRVAVGEITTFTTFPLLCYAGMLLIKKRSAIRLLSVSFCTLLVISSHQAMATFAIPLSLLLLLIINSKKKGYSRFLLNVIMGAIVSSYLLYPYIGFAHFIHVSSYSQVIFQPIGELIYSKWRGGFLYQGPEGELTTPIGYAHLFIIFTALYLHIIKVRLKRLTATLLLLIALFLFLLTPYSLFLWNTIPLIHLLILSSRLLLFIAFVAALLAGVVATQMTNKKLLLILTIAPILISILTWGARNTIYPIHDQILKREMPLSTKGPEGWGIGIPKWKTPMEFEGKIPNESLAFISGNGTIKNLKRTSTYHSYLISTTYQATMRENTWYFPGWNAYVDTQPVAIQKSIQGHEGIIAITVPSGIHKLEFIYKDEKMFMRLKSIAAISLFIYIALCIRGLLKKK